MAGSEEPNSIDTGSLDSDVDLTGLGIEGEEDAFSPEELEAIQEGGLNEDAPLAESREEAPAPKAKEEETEKPPAKDDRTVPLEALHEARAELKALREEQQKMAEWREALVARIQEARAAQEKQEQEANGPPDENEDPLAAIAWLKAQLQQQTEMMQQNQQQQMEQRRLAEQAQRQQQQVSAMMQEADQVITQMAEKNPVIGEAVEFAAQAMRQELSGQNPDWNDTQVSQAVEQAMYNYVYNAPTDPAMLETYIMRNARYWGFEPTPAKQAGRSHMDGMARMERAAAASKTLSGSGTGAGEVNLSDISSMTEEELLALPEDVLDRLVKDA